MKVTSKTARIAIAVAVSGAIMAPAASAFAGDKTERAVIGALLGGAAGAALGHGRTDGVVVGAAAGALLGVATDNNDRRDHRYHRSYRDQRPYYRDGRYSRDYGRTYDRGYYGQSGYGRYDNNYSYGYYR